VIHLLMVVVTGLWNNIRSMLTGWYDIGEEHG
jgi:thiosulfate reductase cytochrome b subunit